MSNNSIQSCGYVCFPRDNNVKILIKYWKNSTTVQDLYFTTATFASESKPYFPNNSNHYILVKDMDLDKLVEGISKYQNLNKPSFCFNIESELFERHHEKISFVSIYFTRNSHDNHELRDIANVLAKREKVMSANLGNLKFINKKQLHFTFPYSNNIIILEVEGQKTHQSDQNYCEKTKIEIARKGISLSNLVSFSILEKLR